jgi:CRP-like cAMP-binding protein
MFFTRTDPIVAQLQGLGISDEAAKRLVAAGTPLVVPGGVDLTVEGTRGEEAFVIVEGHAVVKLGKGRTVRVGPGDVVGEIAALDPLVRRTATVTTEGDTTVLVYDVRSFRSLADSELRDLLVPDRDATAPAKAA